MAVCLAVWALRRLACTRTHLSELMSVTCSTHSGNNLQFIGRQCSSHTAAYSKRVSCEVNKKIGELLFGFADGHISAYLNSNTPCPVYCACSRTTKYHQGMMNMLDVQRCAGAAIVQSDRSPC